MLAFMATVGGGGGMLAVIVVMGHFPLGVIPRGQWPVPARGHGGRPLNQQGEGQHQVYSARQRDHGGGTALGDGLMMARTGTGGTSMLC